MPAVKLPAPVPFNPLDKQHLAKSVAEAMLESPVHPLPPEPFIGAGIYAIYYVGDFEAYNELARSNRDGKFSRPIYVGKAVPEGTRMGGFGLGANPGTVLLKRLREHYKSIAAAENLKIADFYCRFLVVEDIWIPLAESMLIEMFSPVWNKVLDGFGNHDPGKRRYEQQRPFWDEVHPGRSWAEHLNPSSLEYNALVERVKDFLLTDE